MSYIIQFIRKYTLTIIIGGIVLFLSLLRSTDIPSSNWWNFYSADKFVHFGMYLTLSFFLFFEKSRNHNKQPLKLSDNLFPFIGLIVASGIIELIQPHLANRSCELFDFIANSIGVFSGFYFLRFYKKRSER